MTVKVGTKVYQIKHPLEIVEIGGEYYGKHNSDQSEILVANKFSQQIQNESFLHELVHAICVCMDLRDMNRDEHQVELFSRGLAMVIQDNPHIFTMNDIKEENDG